MAESRLQKLSKRGQSVWIDSLSRTMIESGDLERMMRDDAVVGVTTNPTIFQKALAEGDAYDEQLREIAESEHDAKEIFLHSHTTAKAPSTRRCGSTRGSTSRTCT
jgi:transaldolase